MTPEEFRERLRRYDPNWDRIDNYGERRRARDRNAELEQIAASDPELNAVFVEVVHERSAA
jgi:DNA primase large subunit